MLSGYQLAVSSDEGVTDDGLGVSRIYREAVRDQSAGLQFWVSCPIKRTERAAEGLVLTVAPYYFPIGQCTRSVDHPTGRVTGRCVPTPKGLGYDV